MPERECPTCGASFLESPAQRRCPACGDILPSDEAEEELPLVKGTVAPPKGLSEFLYLVGPPKPLMGMRSPPRPKPVPRDED